MLSDFSAAMRLDLRVLKTGTHVDGALRNNLRLAVTKEKCFGPGRVSGVMPPAERAASTVTREELFGCKLLLLPFTYRRNGRTGDLKYGIAHR